MAFRFKNIWSLKCYNPDKYISWEVDILNKVTDEGIRKVLNNTFGNSSYSPSSCSYVTSTEAQLDHWAVTLLSPTGSIWTDYINFRFDLSPYYDPSKIKQWRGYGTTRPLWEPEEQETSTLSDEVTFESTYLYSSVELWGVALLGMNSDESASIIWSQISFYPSKYFSVGQTLKIQYTINAISS